MSTSDEPLSPVPPADEEVNRILSNETRKRKYHPLDEPGQQWTLKLLLTVLSAIVGGIAALYLFRLL